jgi:hypothetical protein
MLSDVHLMDNVIVAPKNDSPFDIRQLAGRTATVFKVLGEDLLAVLSNGASICLARDEVERASSWAERKMERPLLKGRRR